MNHSSLRIRRDAVVAALIAMLWAAGASVPVAAQNTAIQMTGEYQQAQQLLAQSDFDGAIGALQNLFSNRELAAAARIEIGTIRMRQAETEMSQALGHFLDAATNMAEGVKAGGAKGPDSPRILYDLGRVYEERLNDYPKAIDAYSRVLSEYPNFMSIDKVVYHLAFSYERIGKFEDAARMYRELVEKHQYSSFFREAQKRMKSLAPGTGQGVAAIEAQENIADDAQSEAQSAQANMDLAAMQAKQGNYSKAIEAYKKVIADSPNSDQARDAYRLMASMMDEKQKDYKNAAATLEEMMQKFPDAPNTEQSLFKLGRIYEENLTDYKTRVVDGTVRYRKNDEGARKAIDYYDRLTERYPDADVSAEALMRKGDLYRTQLKDPDEAKKQYAEFLKRFPDHAEAEQVRERLNQLESD
ncbi:tetratricopeptide repeat protein [Candidatus Ozemobacteraceae bacterium]|nr:tetratricopeptide repeat protein [Candidatus Ozemobacteraceae bacterium]